MFNYFGNPRTKPRSVKDVRKANRRKEHRDDKKRNRLVEQKTSQSAADREKGYNTGIEKIKNLYNDQSIPGLDPNKRQAMQYEANKGIQRSMQSANRKLLGDQASHGIVGHGGVGYAQQRDLQRVGTEAQSGVHRDLDKLNADLRLKNIAAMFTGGQGEAAQSVLDKQLALDELNLNDEKKRQRKIEDKLNSLFSRV